MEKMKNTTTLRIDNVDTVKMLDELAKQGAFKSKNEVINRALEYGLPILHGVIFGKSKKTQEINVEEVAKEIVAMKTMLVNHTINLNVIEYLLSFLYNVEVARADGIEITRDFIESGCLEQLPDNLAEVKREMTTIEYKKMKDKK